MSILNEPLPSSHVDHQQQSLYMALTKGRSGVETEPRPLGSVSTPAAAPEEDLGCGGDKFRTALSERTCSWKVWGGVMLLMLSTLTVLMIVGAVLIVVPVTSAGKIAGLSDAEVNVSQTVGLFLFETGLQYMLMLVPMLWLLVRGKTLRDLTMTTWLVSGICFVLFIIGVAMMAASGNGAVAAIFGNGMASVGINLLINFSGIPCFLCMNGLRMWQVLVGIAAMLLLGTGLIIGGAVILAPLTQANASPITFSFFMVGLVLLSVGILLLMGVFNIAPFGVVAALKQQQQLASRMAATGDEVRPPRL